MKIRSLIKIWIYVNSTFVANRSNIIELFFNMNCESVTKALRKFCTARELKTGNRTRNTEACETLFCDFLPLHCILLQASCSYKCFIFRLIASIGEFWILNIFFILKKSYLSRCPIHANHNFYHYLLIFQLNFKMVMNFWHTRY